MMYYDFKKSVCFPEQVDFSVPGQMVELLDKFRFELAEKFKEAFAYAIMFWQMDQND